MEGRLDGFLPDKFFQILQSKRTFSLPTKGFSGIRVRESP